MSRRMMWFRRISYVVAGVGLLWSVVMVLQPWASCPYEDSPAGCAVVGAQVGAQAAAFTVLTVGVCGLLVSWVAVSAVGTRQARTGR